MGDREWILARIESFGQQAFLTHKGDHRSFADLARAIQVVRDRLTVEGVSAGQCVALIGDYSIEAVASFVALYLNGNLLVPMAVLTQAEAEARVREAHVDWVIKLAPNKGTTFSRIQKPATPNATLATLRDAGQSGLILFSSGSTGRPKAMVHDLDTLMAAYAHKKARSLAILVFLLFDHIGGLNTLLNGLATGAHLVVPVSRKPEEVAALIEQERIRVLPTSPTFLNLLLMSGAAEQYNLSSLRIITYGTEPMPESLLKRLMAAFPRAKLLQTFGTSETGISHTVSRSSSSLEMKIDDPNTEVRVVDGELWLRSKTQIHGYLNASMERFTEDGWFRTGDQVELTDDGFIRILGRASEVINVGGEKVMPAEVESVLMELPGVRDCLVYGKSNPITGQVVAAELVLVDCTDPAGFKRALKRHCRQRMAAYKVPVYVAVVDRLESSDRFKKVRRKAES